MKLWIITSSPDNLYLFKFFHEHNFSYHIWYDQEWGHRWDKSPDFVQKRIESGIDYLIEQWVTKCILPPSRELVFLGIEKYKNYILPLFSTFLTQQILPGSRIGKIWLLWDYADLEQQQALKDMCATYTLSEKQQSIKWFQQPMQYWSKQVPMRKHFLVSLGRKDWMMHNVVKNDLNYFTDAWVDTLIPLNYWYFAYDVTISKFFRTKKCNRHRIEKLASVFTELTKEYEKDAHSVTISHTWTLAHLQAEKKWMWMLQKGKEIVIDIKKI